jgi:hypothetical protein
MNAAEKRYRYLAISLQILQAGSLKPKRQISRSTLGILKMLGAFQSLRIMQKSRRMSGFTDFLLG